MESFKHIFLHIAPLSKFNRISQTGENLAWTWWMICSDRPACNELSECAALLQKGPKFSVSLKSHTYICSKERLKGAIICNLTPDFPLFKLLDNNTREWHRSEFYKYIHQPRVYIDYTTEFESHWLDMLWSSIISFCKKHY